MVFLLFMLLLQSFSPFLSPSSFLSLAMSFRSMCEQFCDLFFCFNKIEYLYHEKSGCIAADIMCNNGYDFFPSNIQACYSGAWDIRHTPYSKCLKHYKHDFDAINDFFDQIGRKKERRHMIVCCGWDKQASSGGNSSLLLISE